MENLATERISILILAGGKSSRMGRDKALIPINGVVMLERICLVATECSNSVQVVTPWPERYQHIVPQDCGFLPELGGEGPLVAFAQSLPTPVAPSREGVGGGWVLLLACDLPLLLEKDIREWIGYLEVVKEEVVAVLPKSEKGWEPLCGFYRRRCLPNLTDFIAQGGRSFQSWLSLQPVVELPITDASVLFNCNTPEDLDILVTADDCEALRKQPPLASRPWRPQINADEWG